MKKVFTSSSTFWSCFIALAMMLVSQGAWAEYVKLTALDGTGGTGGEGYPCLVDANQNSKMGTQFDPANGGTAYIVVKAEKAVVPDWYFLVTGNDTGGSPGRNWKKWNIYGGNFASDAEAVRDVENYAGWTLIDARDDAELLPAANFGTKDFQFNQADGKTAYQYYWIEILESVEGANVYLQMSEWGLGSYGDFQAYLEALANKETGKDEPIVYNIIAGDRNDGSGEGLDKLFDGNIGTKWGNGFSSKPYGSTESGRGAYFIVKTSRAIAPTYYKLVTGTDNASWNHRNWKNWQIYAISDADAATMNGKPTRDSDKWILLDKKDNISEEILPDKNSFTVIFNLSETNTTAYRYYRVEIDAIQSDGYMQMSEFSLGDEFTLAIDRNATLATTADFDPNIFAEKALLDKYAQLISSVENCNDPFELGNLNLSISETKAQVETSESNYAELISVRNQAINYINEENLDDEAMTYIKVWISEANMKAPDEDYPVGNFAYIKNNRQITGAEALAEVKRVSDYLINHTKFIDDPIYSSYTWIDGSGGFGGEDESMLIDGDRNSTKWCTDKIPGFLIFKSDEPIKPTYYGLVTGGDTYSYPDRNWKTWRIYGANFESDEEAKQESDKWVLIDDKKNVGTDVLKTTNVYESYINLSIGCTEPYQYFMIYVEAAGGGLMQMNEFTFYNLGNLFEYREQFVSEFADYDPEAEPAYIGYVNDFKEKFETLQTATNAPDVMKAYNEMAEIQATIASSVEKYQKYDSLYNELTYVSFESESLSEWYDGYTGENVGPGVKYIRGTHNYIMENRSLDNTTMDAELSYIQGIINSANESLYILLGGHTVGEWGDGFYGNLIDGIAKNSEDEDGNKVNATKWGGQADPSGDTYIIFRTSDPVYPFFYTLTTGNDTGTYQDRNWGTWYIYAANFEGDGAATKDAEGWVLVDAKENVGKDRLHPVDAEESYFGFSTEGTTEYTYYKIVVTKAFGGNAIQMNEIHFGTEEEFNAIKDQYKQVAEEFDTEVIAQQSLLDEYEETIPQIEECTNMEDLFKVNYHLETLRETINTSAASYAKFKATIESNLTYLEENSLADSEAKTIFVNYLSTEEAASELYPNGTGACIVAEHEVNDSILAVELDFMETLKAAAVAAGYGPGMDVSSLIVNRTFAKATEMLKDEQGADLGREAEGWNGYIYRTNNDGESGVYAAEFCVGNRTFDISQTLTNLKNGYYKVTLNAGYRANGDNTMLSYNYAAMAYANGIYTYVPVIREGAADSLSAWHGAYPDTKIYSLDSTEVYGWGIYGCEGAAHAFAQGRYAITLVAKVTDGTLTLGVKNEGTLSNEWTAAGNFGLYYIGEDVADAAEALGEAAEYNAARINTLTELYVSDVSDEENYPLAPGFGQAQKDALIANSGQATFEAEQTISDIMQSIYETKKAYVDLLQASTKVYAKWYEYAGNADAEEAVYIVRDNLQLGTYDDAAAAKQAKADFYAQWPEFLQMKGKGNNVEFVQDEFALDIITTGINPSIELTTLYEALEEGEVILSFDYKAQEDLEGGYFYYETPNMMTGVKEDIPALPAESEWKTVYYDISKGVETFKFGSATDHAIFWNITNLASKDKSYELSARNFRIITKARMASEGGKTLNGIPGDLNGDGDVNIADAVTVLNAMASNPDDVTFDLNGDGKVDISDFVCVLNLMAE